MHQNDISTEIHRRPAFASAAGESRAWARFPQPARVNRLFMALALLFAALFCSGLFATPAKAQAACTEIASGFGPNIALFRGSLNGSCTTSTGVVMTWAYSGTSLGVLTNNRLCGYSNNGFNTFPLINDGTFTVTYSAPARSIGIVATAVDSVPPPATAYTERNVLTFTNADPPSMTLQTDACGSTNPLPVLEGNSLRGSGSASIARALVTATYPSAQTSFQFVVSHTNGAPPGPYTTTTSTNGLWMVGATVPQLPRVTLAKTTLNGAGANTFGFGLSSAAPVTVQPNPATNSITVNGASSVTSPTVHTVRTGGDLTITESSVPAGWPANPTNIICADSAVPGTNIATQSGNAATISSSALVLGANITCTFTNAQPVDLSITKTNTPAAGPSDQANDSLARGAPTTYTLVVRNGGPGSVTGAVVTDTPTAGLTCPAGNAVTIDYSGTTPDTSSTVGALTSGGITLGLLNNGETATLTFTCNVN